MAPFAATIFLGALLLFLLQPIIGRFILPWFGGAASVWTICLLFFQIGLLAGYAYAHWISRRRAAARWIHVAALLASLWLLPIGPDPEVWKPSDGGEPALWILLLLTANVGLPFFLLAATTPLLTRGFERCFPTASPYRLYALSNAGSLLALVAYPFVLEPYLTRSAQSLLWSCTYGAFLVGCAWCIFRWWRDAPRSPTAETDTPVDNALGPTRSSVLLWVALSACGSALLVSTTNQLCQEVAVVPLLWLLPLGLYVGSFILCFDHPRWYRRRLFVPALALLMLPACGVLYAGPLAPLWLQVVAYSLTLFVCCMTCHGELYGLKPRPRWLTAYYLSIAAGGALGGVLVALVAPLLFPGYWEYHLALIGSCLLTAIASLHNGVWDFRRAPRLRQAVGVGLVALVVVLVGEMYFGRLGAEVTVRNFYGVLRLKTDRDDAGPYRRLVHGRIDHGRQYLAAEKRRWPTLFFGTGSGIDLAVRYHPRSLNPRGLRREMRIGVVGLGVGTIAAYGQPGDSLRFYEINPAVQRLCQRHFTFLKDTPADTQVILGDARLSMERELKKGHRQLFDVLVIDAFRNDAIPIHLLTEQCAEVYFGHLRDDGLLLLHVSNRFVDLRPVARGIARRFGHTVLHIISEEDPRRGTKAGHWLILTNNVSFLSHPAVRRQATLTTDGPVRRWTDDYAAIRHVLK